MDAIDRTILQLLQEDAKISYFNISEKLNIGTSTVHFRIKKMIDNDIIKNFSIVVDHEKVGYTTKAWVGLSVDPKKIDGVAKKLASYEEIQLVSTASGTHEIVFQIISKDEKKLWNFINNNIKPLDGVKKGFHVSCFLDCYKNAFHKVIL